MNVTIYLPDEVGRWAKEQDLPLSRMLRDAVESERSRRGAAEAVLKDARTFELGVVSPDGRGYTVRLHGAVLADDGEGPDGVMAFLGRDEKVYVYDGRRDGELHRDVDPADLSGWLDEAGYFEAMRALGMEAVIDVGLPGGE